MRPAAENIEKLVKKLRYQASAEAHDRIRENVLEELDTFQKQKSGAVAPNIRRTIMKSPITKLAAAAAIIVAGLLLLSQFTGSANILPAALAQVVEAVKKQPWMHTVTTTTFSKPGESGVWERWISFEYQVEADIQADGKVIFEDYSQQKTYVYEPSTEIITIHGPLAGAVGEGTSGPLEYLLMKIQDQDEGVKVKFKQKRTEQAEIYEITRLIETPLMKGIEVAELKVDLKTYLPVALEVRLTGCDGQLLYSGSTDFEYPTVGPRDIFDLGVPRTAKMVQAQPKE